MAWRATIDDGIPLPLIAKLPGAPKGIKFAPRIPFRRMAVGQSVFVPEEIMSRRNVDNRVSAMAYRDARSGYPPFKFVIRKWAEKGVLGTRVWRIE